MSYNRARETSRGRVERRADSETVVRSKHDGKPGCHETEHRFEKQLYPQRKIRRCRNRKSANDTLEPKGPPSKNTCRVNQSKRGGFHKQRSENTETVGGITSKGGSETPPRPQEAQPRTRRGRGSTPRVQDKGGSSTERTTVIHRATRGANTRATPNQKKAAAELRGRTEGADKGNEKRIRRGGEETTARAGHTTQTRRGGEVRKNSERIPLQPRKAFDLEDGRE